MVELLVIIAIIGILSAIAIPSWQLFLQRLRLNAAQAEALNILRTAQNHAKREKRVWQASFRQENNQVQWSVHSEDSPPVWKNLLDEDADQIDIDEANSTFRRYNEAYGVQFQYKGRTNGQLGRITFTYPGTNSTNTIRRCVFVSTLLGAMRTDSDRGCLR